MCSLLPVQLLSQLENFTFVQLPLLPATAWKCTCKTVFLWHASKYTQRFLCDKFCPGKLYLLPCFIILGSMSMKSPFISCVSWQTRRPSVKVSKLFRPETGTPTTDSCHVLKWLRSVLSAQRDTCATPTSSRHTVLESRVRSRSVLKEKKRLWNSDENFPARFADLQTFQQ